MTEDLREYTEEDKKRRDPKWIAPVRDLLVSEDSREVTGRVFPGRKRYFRRRRGLA